MIVILQRYIFRELVRAFLLTAVALTCMLGFGGGLVDMLKSQGITAGEMVKLLVYLTPVVLTYSLPVAALFSTTITYGRFSAANEIDACRASGVNIHKLLVPAVVLSVIVSVFTFSLENFAIPKLTREIKLLVKRDIQSIAAYQLRRKGYIARMNYAMHCGKVGEAVLPVRAEDGTMQPGHIPLSQVAFVKHENGEPVLYGTAKTAMIQFDHLPEGLAVRVFLNQVRAFNKDRGQTVQVAFLPLDRPVIMPSFQRHRIKFLSLPQLLATASNPLLFADVKSLVNRLNSELRQALVYEVLIDQYRQDGLCRLKDDKHDYVIDADRFLHDYRDGRIMLENARITRSSSDGSRTFLAREATIRVSNRGNEITIALKNITVNGFADFEREDVTFSPVAVPSSASARADSDAYSLDRLLDRKVEFDFNDEFAKVRGGAIDLRKRVINRCIAELHTRLAYSSSALVLLVLGAALGIMFHGGHFVSAFGLSFIPMMVVVVLIITGKQIAGVGELGIGTTLIWSGCALVAFADVVILRTFLRR